MSISKLASFRKPIKAICNDGSTTLIYVVVNRTLYSYALSGGAIVKICTFLKQPTCMVCDATYIYLAFGNELWRFTIADGAASTNFVQKVKFDSPIVCMDNTTTTMYVGLACGKIYSKTP
jgi:hypothetical protein